MSKHVKLSDEAQKALNRQKQSSVIASFFVSVGVLALMGLILGTLAVFIPDEEADVIISYQANLPEPDSLEPQVNEQIQRSVPSPSSSASSVADVIASISSDAVSVPVPVESTSVESVEFGEIDDFGDAMSFESDEAPDMTFFGTTGGGGMKGYLYDFKQNSKSKESKLGKYYMADRNIQTRIPVYQKAVKSAVDKNFHDKALEGYFKHSTSLSMNYLVIDKDNATVGPKAFGAEGVIAPAGWLVKYEGVLKRSRPRKMRFMGLFDDTMMVFINDKLVLDASWQEGYSGEFNKYELNRDIPQIFRKPFRMSEYLQLNAGDKITIVLGEGPGGHLEGGLFVEEEGVVNPGVAKDGNYLPIPFCTMLLTERDKELLAQRKVKVCVDNVPVFSIQQ